MKKFLTLRNVLICAGAFLALLVFIFSFVAELRAVNPGGDFSNLNFIWGGTKVRNNATGAIADSGDGVGVVVLPMLGAILSILGGLCAVVIALCGDKLFKNEKVAKIVLLVAGGLIVLGGVFTLFAKEGYIGNVAREEGITVEQYKAWIQSQNITLKCGLPIVSGILGIVGGGAIILSQFVQEKSLAK